MQIVQLFTDGACLGNPGPGGWCCIMRMGPHERVLRGGEPQTTNNRMEILAVLEGLRALNKSCRLEIYSDSQYVLKGIDEWLPGWIRKGWINSQKKPVANVDLWKEMHTELEPHQVSVHWVKGHAGHPENERCDKIAKEEAMVFSRG